MTKTAIDTAIPSFLRRTNAKGVTLSAGPAAPTTTATGAKLDAPKAPKVKAARVNVKTVKAPAAPKAPKAAKGKAPAAPKTVKAKDIGATGTVIDPETGEAVVKVVKSIVPAKFKERYAKNNGTCGDDMAKELKAATTMLNSDKRETLDVEALKRVAAQNGLGETLDGYIAKKLNNGQLRMNVGNKLRGLLKAGTDVTVGTGKTKRVFKAEDLEV